MHTHIHTKVFCSLTHNNDSGSRCVDMAQGVDTHGCSGGALEHFDNQ